MERYSGHTEFQQYCIEQELPFVSFRLPGKTQPVTFISNTGIDYLPAITEEQVNDFDNPDKTGFLIAPFLKSNGRIWINADQVLTGDNIIEFDKDSVLHEAFGSVNELPEASTLPDEITKTEYLSRVRTIIETIKEGAVNKVVISRPLHISFNRKEDGPALFKQLCSTLKSAFVYFLSVPGSGTWMGATPEVLLTASSETTESLMQIQTMALAGTRKAGTMIPWGEKEIDEQQWVASYIYDKLHIEGLSHIQRSTPYTSVAGNIEHLRSDFSALIQESNLEKITNHLHPTPAVCGWPSDKALDLIIKTEGYDRSLYSGYLGPVNFQNITSLFVNLRCMKLARNKAALFVGGGITSGSDPEQEWEETIIKSQTLLAEIEKIKNLAS